MRFLNFVHGGSHRKGIPAELGARALFGPQARVFTVCVQLL